jgi:hypothetical protein
MPPHEDSWRVVEGEHDSFDASLLEDGFPPNAQPSSALPSQLSSFSFGTSFGASFGGVPSSQDSIRDFARHRDDDNVILREPFRPTMPPPPWDTAAPRRRRRPLEVNPYITPPPESVREHDHVPRHPAAFPLAGLIAGALFFIYTTMSGLIFLHNFATYPLSLSVLPLCRVPLANAVISCSPPPRDVCFDLADFDESYAVLVELARMSEQRLGLEALLADTKAAAPAFAHLRSVLDGSNVAHRKEVIQKFESYNLTAKSMIKSVHLLRASMNNLLLDSARIAEDSTEHLRVSSTPTAQGLSSLPSSWIFWPVQIPRGRIDDFFSRKRHRRHAASLIAGVNGILRETLEIDFLLDAAKAQVQAIVCLDPRPDSDVASRAQGTLGFNTWTLLAAKSVSFTKVHNSLAALNSLVDRYSVVRSDLRDFDSYASFLLSLVNAPKAREGCSPVEGQIRSLDMAAVQLRDTLESIQEHRQNSGHS